MAIANSASMHHSFSGSRVQAQISQLAILEETSYSLMRSGRHRDDAQALTVLELTEKATPRWTINLY